MVAKRTLFPSYSSRKRRRKVSSPQYTGARPELQYFTTQIIADAKDINVLAGIIRGSSRGQRSGDTIRIKKVQVSFPPIGQSRAACKCYLYSRNGNASPILPSNTITYDPDRKNYRIWDQVNQWLSTNLLGNSDSLGTDGGIGPGARLTKTFSKPMKVIFDNSTVDEEQENGVYVSAQQILNTTGTPLRDYTFTSTNPGLIQVWFYDA